MKALKNNYLWSIIGMFSLLSCDNNTHNIKVEEGYLKSTTYQEYLGGYKEDKSNTDYSTRRMFLLLGEEAFLYSSDYNFYAIYCYVSKENNDFYIMKSKDNIVCLSHKKLHTTDGFFYTNRSEDLDSDGRAFRMDVTTRLIEKDTLYPASDFFKKTIVSMKSKAQVHPAYGSPFRGLYLFNAENYYLINDFNIDIAVMNEIDSFFRKSLPVE